MLKVFIVKTDEKDARKVSASLFEDYFKRETGLALKHADLKKTKNGKALPVEGYYSNISHSGGFWCMGINDTDVGVDIEKRRELRIELARRILVDGEEALDGDLLRSWALKEAYVKYLGDGIEKGLTSFTCEKVFQECRVEDYSTEEYVCFVVTGQIKNDP